MFFVMLRKSYSFSLLRVFIKNGYQVCQMLFSVCVEVNRFFNFFSFCFLKILLLLTFLKSLLNLLQYCFCCLWVFFPGLEACGVLTPGLGIEPTPPALGGKVLTNPWTTKEAPHSVNTINSSMDFQMLDQLCRPL